MVRWVGKQMDFRWINRWLAGGSVGGLIDWPGV